MGWQAVSFGRNFAARLIDREHIDRGAASCSWAIRRCAALFGANLVIVLAKIRANAKALARTKAF